MKEEQIKESNDRLKEFMEKHKYLCENYEVELIGVPKFSPVTDYAWGIQIGIQPFDKKGLAQKSPIQSEDLNGLK